MRVRTYRGGAAPRTRSKHPHGVVFVGKPRSNACVVICVICSETASGLWNYKNGLIVGKCSLQGADGSTAAGHMVHSLNSASLQAATTEYPWVHRDALQRHVPGGVSVRTRRHREEALHCDDCPSWIESYLKKFPVTNHVWNEVTLLLERKMALFDGFWFVPCCAKVLTSVDLFFPDAHHSLRQEGS